jgi:hypothetical protein
MQIKAISLFLTHEVSTMTGVAMLTQGLCCTKYSFDAVGA